MEKETEDQQVNKEIEEIIGNLGFSVVELKKHAVKGTQQIRIVIYSSSGISIEDCTEVHRTIRPRLEILLDTQELNIEVCSPGIGRTLKNNREFTVFMNKSIKLLRRDNEEWTEGLINSVENDFLFLKTDDKIEKIALQDIRKAKLL